VHGSTAIGITDTVPITRGGLASAGFTLVLTLIAAYVVIFINPFRWGIAQSERFSWETFERIRPERRIGDVVADMGNPIRAPEQLEVIDAGDAARNDPCFPRRCRAYRFLGKSGSRWPPSYDEAIVVVGPDERVVYTVRREE
jgi:hypothetical protein